MHLKLYKLESKSSHNPVCTLSNGHHTLGRGTMLDCADKRISRNHVLIEVDGDKATIMLLHETNPCYWRKANSTHMILLKVNVCVDITEGDMFGFFPDANWYRIEFSSTLDNNEDAEETAEVSELGEIPQGDEESIPSISNQSNSDSNLDNLNGRQDCSENVPIESEVEEKDTVIDNAITGQIPASQIKGECDTSVSDNTPSCSGTTNTNHVRQYRDRCWYGSSCYRKCQKHKAKYSHVGDNDYDTDPNDDRPLCPYGRNCYRRNGVHRRSFQHSSKARGKRPADDDGDLASIDPANIIPTKRAKKNRLPESSDDEEDESEECPFATDDEDDDYDYADDEDDE